MKDLLFFLGGIICLYLLCVFLLCLILPLGGNTWILLISVLLIAYIVIKHLLK